MRNFVGLEIPRAYSNDPENWTKEVIHKMYEGLLFNKIIRTKDGKLYLGDELITYNYTKDCFCSYALIERYCCI